MESHNEPTLGSPTRPVTGPRLRPFESDSRPEVLSPPGNLYDVYKFGGAGITVRRHPLVFSPSSSAQVNHRRLPTRAMMKGMNLAYREQAFSDGDLPIIASRRLIMMFTSLSTIAIGLVIAGLLIPWKMLLIIAGALACVLLVRIVWHQSITLKRVALAIVGPIALVFAAKLATGVFQNRLLGSTLFAVATLFMFVRFGREPLRFFRDWLFAHPRIPASVRRAAGLGKRFVVTTADGKDVSFEPIGPSYIILAAILTVAIAVPWYSTGLALILLGGAAATTLLPRRGGPSPLESARTVMGQYLTYGGNTSYAPGVWIPRLGLAERQGHAWLMLVPLYFALTIGLTLFAPDLEFFLAMNELSSFKAQATTVGGSDLGFRSPGAWVAILIADLRAGNYTSIWLVPIALAFALALPPLLIVLIYQGSLAQLEWMRLHVDRVDPAGDIDWIGDDERTEWDWYNDRLRLSEHEAPDPLGGAIREADQLFLGVEPDARFPVLLDKSLLSEHVYMVGDSGSGKTSLGLMPLLIQLIRGQNAGGGEMSPSPPIVVLDLKGDPALFHTAREEAERRGVPFRFFTPEVGRASHYFNPFLSIASEQRSDIQLANLMLDALSLNHGDGYGRGFYSRQNRQLLYDALTHEDRPQSFQELYDVVGDLRAEKPETYRDTFELISTIHALQTYDNLAVSRSLAKPEQAIHMPSVLEERQVVYFWLPAAVESISVREIAKLALYSLLTAAIDRQRTHPRAEQRQAFVFIDEFQRIAAENFKVILEQARSFGVGAVLANQSVSDLNTPAVDLRPTVRTNTRVKRYFSVTDPADMRALSESSGEEVMVTRSWMQRGDSQYYTEYTWQWYHSKSDTQSLKHRLTLNDIAAASDHPLDSILHVSRGAGYTQFAGLPIVARSTWPISKAEYERRQDAPWPIVEDYDEEAVMTPSRSPVEIDRERDQEAADMVYQKMLETLRDEA